MPRKKNTALPTDVQEWTALIGPRIRAIRQKRGKSQSQLARLVGLNHSNISVLEKGTALPSVQTLYMIGKVLRVKPGSLLP